MIFYINGKTKHVQFYYFSFPVFRFSFSSFFNVFFCLFSSFFHCFLHPPTNQENCDSKKVPIKYDINSIEVSVDKKSLILACASWPYTLKRFGQLGISNCICNFLKDSILSWNYNSSYYSSMLLYKY